jgi:hypothetical protein
MLKVEVVVEIQVERGLEELLEMQALEIQEIQEIQEVVVVEEGVFSGPRLLYPGHLETQDREVEAVELVAVAMEEVANQEMLEVQELLIQEVLAELEILELLETLEHLLLLWELVFLEVLVELVVREIQEILETRELLGLQEAAATVAAEVLDISGPPASPMYPAVSVDKSAVAVANQGLLLKPGVAVVPVAVQVEGMVELVVVLVNHLADIQVVVEVEVAHDQLEVQELPET